MIEKKKIFEKRLKHVHVAFATRCKGEFEKLVRVILKNKKSFHQKILELLWEAAWEQRKHGAEDELGHGVV